MQAVDLVEILRRSSGRLGVALDEPAAGEIARRARGTPRIALRLLRRVRDFAEVQGAPRERGAPCVNKIARFALARLEVDEVGFDRLDRAFLRVLIEKFDGGPVGLSTLCASLHEEKDSIEERIEPYLLQIGFLNRTPRGRMATRLAYEHFGLPSAPSQPKSQGLFDS